MFSSIRRTTFLGMERVSNLEDSQVGRPATESPSAEAAGSIIGVVIFTTHRGERAEAILDGEGRWRCPCLPVLDRVLNILFEPSGEQRNGASFGHAELDRVAAWIKGRASLSVIP